MARCPSCDFDNPAEFRFCGACGIGLSPGGCSSCGFANPAGQRFCGRCGAQLGADPGSRVNSEYAERKLATVLFADVVGFTALAEASDPEALASKVDTALRRIAEVVVEHGGTIDKYLGDALMAVFGVPMAHGDDAERAVAAALRMREIGGDLRFAIGINSGEVMVTTVGDGGDRTVIGDAVNVASRLEDAAGAGEILLGPLTAELVADRFVLRERAATLLRGRSEPVAVFEAVSRRQDDDGSSALAPPLVGRQAELDFLCSCWRRAAERSRSQVVLLTGDAGVGKTRLADELAARTLDGPAAVRAGCPGYGALVGSRLAVDLGRQLGVNLGAEAHGGSENGAVMSPAGFDDSAVWRLRRSLADRAREHPLLVVIDDVHNASAADLEPLVQLTARIGDLPVTVLLCGRPLPADWLTRFPGATTLHLDPLTPSDAAALATVLAGEDRLPPEGASALAAQADGNPLHLRELVRLLRAHGDLAVAGTRGERSTLPPTLQAVLAARLDALAGADKAVLQDVAIFSDGATAAEAESLVGSPTQASLDRLVGAGMLRHSDSRYEVGDPLLREVAYEQLPHVTRGDLHRRAAELASTSLGRARHLALAASFIPGDQGLRDEAAAELSRTGLALLEVGRFRDGAKLVRQALELGHDDPATLLRLAQAENDAGRGGGRSLELLDRIDTRGDPRLEAEVLQARGNAVRGVDMQSSLDLLTQAAERWAALGDMGKRGWALANRGMTLFDLGRVEDAAASHEEALEIFRRLDDGTAMVAMGQSLALERPEDPRAPQWLSDGLRVAEEAGDLARQRNALIPLSWSRFVRDHLGGERFTADPRHDAERLARVSAEMGDASFEVQALCIIAVLDRMAGRLDEAAARVAQARQAMLGASEYSQPLLEAVEYMLRLACGGAESPRPEPHSVPSPLAVVADSLVVEGLLLAGHLGAAAEHLAGIPSDDIVTASPFFARLLGVTRGAVLVLSGDADAAESGLSAAREVSRALGAYSNEVIATALLSEIEATRGNPEGARALVASVAEDPGGVAGLLLERARAVLGDADALQRLEAGARSLAAPGLVHIEYGSHKAVATTS